MGRAALAPEGLKTTIPCGREPSLAREDSRSGWGWVEYTTTWGTGKYLVWQYKLGIIYIYSRYFATCFTSTPPASRPVTRVSLARSPLHGDVFKLSNLIIHREGVKQTKAFKTDRQTDK